MIVLTVVALLLALSPAFGQDIAVCTIGEVEGNECQGALAPVPAAEITGSDAMMSCVGGSVIEGMSYNECVTNGGAFGARFPGSLNAGDWVVVYGTYVFTSAANVPAVVGGGPDPESPDEPLNCAQEFQVGCLDEGALARHFSVGFILIFTAWAIGKAVSVPLGLLRRR